jgi:high-affinity nickel-transport protein
MNGPFQSLRSSPSSLRHRVVGISLLLVAANLGAWIVTTLAFHDSPVLLGTALLAYGFGLRHAVDADHIAAIDNVTRKLMQLGQRPVGVGLYFSLGHSTIVIGLSAAIAFTSVELKDNFSSLESVGGFVGTGVSAVFLIGIALANLFVLSSVYETFRAVKSGEPFVDEDLNLVLAKRGFFGRIFRSLFGLITRSWHMYLLGFLFGLGFDTATEVGVLGISATQACKGLPIWSIMLFPALFTSGMALVDSADSILMLGAYGWAFVRPIRKLYYNMAITFISVVVALLVGGIEVVGLVGEQFKFQGWAWDKVNTLYGNFGALGLIIIGLFLLSWLASVLIYRWQRYDDIKVVAGSTV